MKPKMTTIGQMKTALGQLKNLMAQVTRAAVQDIAALDGRKQDKATAGSVTIPATGWGSDSTAGYPKYYDLAVSGVTASDRAELTLAPAALSTATACGLCPTCETLAGKVRLRAASVPAVAMAANYWIEKGA